MATITQREARELIRETEAYLRRVATQTGPRVAPSSVAGWSGVLKWAFRVFAIVGLIQEVKRLVDLLTSWQTVEKSLALLYLEAYLRYLRNNTDVLVRLTSTSDTAAADPSAILRHDLNRLRGDVALQEVWRRGHRQLIHGPIGQAEGARTAATNRLSLTVSTLADTTADAFGTMVTRIIPQLEKELRQRVRAERDARARGDRQLATRIRTEVEARTKAVTALRTYVETVVEPRIARQIDVETQTRTQEDVAIRRALAQEVRTRTDVDTQLQTQVATILGNILPPVLTATQKVHRTEGVFDRMLRNNVPWAAALMSPPGLTALVMRILTDVAPRVPGAFLAFEKAAWRAL